MAITSNNVQNVKFLRNGTLFSTREAARTALNGFELTYEKDGTAILARYGSDDAVKTLVGWVYANNSGNKSITIFDIDDAGTDAKNYVDSLVGSGITSANTATAQLEALSGSSLDTSGVTSIGGAKTYAKNYTDGQIDALDYTGVTTGTGVYISNVTEANGVISATTATLPSLTEVKETGKPIVAVSEDKGQVAASVGTINAEFVNIADSGSLITATNVEGAIAEIAAEIDGMDKSASAVDGQVVTTVSETDGVVSETKANVKDLQLGGYSKSSSTGAIASADTINEALSKLENKAAAITIDNDDHSINVTTAASGTNVTVNIKSGEDVIKLGNDGIYTDIKLSGITPSNANVREEYALIASNGTTQLGTSIKVYKDSALKSVYIGHVDDTINTETGEQATTGTGDTALCFIYHKEDGSYELAAVNAQVFLEETEFASGVTATNHVVHGVVAGDSESFLTVDASGFKLSGVQDAINTAISGLDASVSAETTSKHVSVKIDEVDGKLTSVTLTDSDIASQAKLEELSGKSVTAVEMTGGTASTATTTDGTHKITINADGSSIKMTGYDKSTATSGAVSANDSVNVAIGKLENQITGNIDALDADVSGNTTHVKVNVVEANGVITNVNVEETDIASANDLTNEIAERKAVDGQSGQTYAANSGKAYISGATSLNDADIKLNDALVSLDADVIKAVKVNGSGLTETDNTVNIIIEAVNAAQTQGTPLTITTDANGKVSISFGSIDCGEYPIE